MTMPPDSPDLSGTLLAGQFRIRQGLGQGGMGAVYLADQLGVGRPVVVKLMHPVENPEQRAHLEQRFQREARVVAQLNHPNLVHIYTFGRCDDGRLYLAMEYVPGKTLRQLLDSEGAFAERRVLDIIHQICNALAHAHAMGVVHRDLKPDNVMLIERQGQPDHVKVLDFGIAKLTGRAEKALTATGMIFGTPQYMAPEQVHARSVDQRTDIYALGLIAYELLTGQPAFDADSAVGLMMKQVSAPVIPPSQRRGGLRVAPATEAMIERCLQKAPENRFSTIEELQVSLGEALQQLATRAGGRAARAKRERP
jgi:serine/threonine-protein kinase